MKDTIFVCIIKTSDQDLNAKKVTLAKNCIKILRKVKKDGLPCDNTTIIKLLKGFQGVFAKDLTELPIKQPFEHKIELKGSLPKSRLIYRLIPREDQALIEYLKEAIRKGHIRSSSAPYGAAVFFVNKKDVGLRLVTDFRALKQVVIKNKYPCPSLTTSSKA